MTLVDLLALLRGGILRDTSDQVAGDSDQLWSDTQLVSYIDQAQRRFARRSLCIRDGTSPITRFVTVPFQQDYTLDPSIMTVLSVRSLGNGAWVNGVYTPGAFGLTAPFAFVPSSAPVIYPDARDLVRSSHSARRRYRGDDCEPFDVNNLQTLNPGKPLTFETDETMVENQGSAGGVSVRLYPMPDATWSGCVMQMRVSRLPVARLTPVDLEAVPEIPEDYHVDMLDYAAYLALRVVDHEAGDPTRAQEFKASFDAHVEEARREILRKTFQPQPWGFGGGGFGYTPN